MQPERTSRLVARLKAHLASTGISQVAFSRELGLSAQNFSLIIRGINCPNSETTLQINEILEQDNMKTEVVDPPKMPRVSTRDPDRPRTLSEAGEVIETLRAEVAQLKKTESATTVKTIVPTPLTKPKLAGADSPPYSTDGSYAPDKNAPKMPVNVPAIVRKTWPKSGVDTPYRITEFLKTAPFATLLDYLADTNATALQRGLVYAAVKERRELGDG